SAISRGVRLNPALCCVGAVAVAPSARPCLVRRRERRCGRNTRIRNMNLGGRALFMMMATSCAPRGTAVQKRASAFTALSSAWCRCPNLMSPPARQKHTRPARLPCAGAGTPRPVTMQQMCLAHNNQLACPGSRSRFFTMQIFMTSNNDDDGGSSCDVDMETRTSYNVPLLKKETTRLTLRTHKKIGKASTRLRAAEEQYDKLRVAMDASPTEELDEELLQRLEQAPNVEQFASELEELRARLKKLNWLEDQFGKSPLKRKKTLSVEDLQKLVPDGAQVVQYVEELEISDDESQKKKRIEADERNRRSKAEKAAKLKDENNVPQGGRLPYRRYYTEQKVEIRVSERARGQMMLTLLR
ncbi:hypothetical protein ACHAWF_001355, partial [Thalassiosira exigua]